MEAGEGEGERGGRKGVEREGERGGREGGGLISSGVHEQTHKCCRPF